MLIRNRIARAMATGTLVLAAPMLTSCGFNFATDQVYTPAPGANNRDESVDVLNAVIVATEDGKGTFLTTLVNNEITPPGVGSGGTNADDMLTGISGEATADIEPIKIRAGDYTRIATTTESFPAGRPGVDQEGIPVTGDFKLGGWVKLTLTFKNSEPVDVEVPVLTNSGQWAGQDGETLTEFNESPSADSDGN